MRPGPRCRLQLVAAAVLFSTAGAALKASTLDSWQVACFRSAVAAATLPALVPAARRRWTWPTAAVGVPYAVTTLLFVRANKMTTAASTIFLQAASPLYIALLGPWLLGERVRRRDVVLMAALGLALALIFLGTPATARTAPDPVQGNLLAATCGFTVAVMMIGLRWLARAGGDAAGSAPAAVVIGNLMAVGLALPWSVPVEGARPADWLLIAYLGVFQIGVAYALMLAALRHLSALEASLLLFVEPVLSPLWAWLLHDERPGPFVLAGGALILAATAAWLWLDPRRPGTAVRSGSA